MLTYEPPSRFVRKTLLGNERHKSSANFDSTSELKRLKNIAAVRALYNLHIGQIIREGNSCKKCEQVKSLDHPGYSEDLLIRTLVTKKGQ